MNKKSLLIGFLIGLFSCYIYSEPSYSCEGSLNSSEKKVCGDDELSLMDSVLADLYKNNIGNLKPENQNTLDRLKSEQRNWLKTKNLCKGNEACLRKVYSMRIYELSEYLVDAQGDMNCLEVEPSYGATCSIIDKKFLGKNNSNNIFYQRIKRTYCYRGCDEPCFIDAVYEEDKKGRFIYETSWRSSCKTGLTELKKFSINASDTGRESLVSNIDGHKAVFFDQYSYPHGEWIVESMAVNSTGKWQHININETVKYLLDKASIPNVKIMVNHNMVATVYTNWEATCCPEIESIQLGLVNDRIIIKDLDSLIKKLKKDKAGN